MTASPNPPPSVGQSPPRPDGAAKVRGEPIYVDDLSLPGAWHGATVRSPHAAARVLRIDPGPALAADPEVTVLTAADLPGPNVVALIADDWPVLAGEQVRHAGEAVALVAAPTRARAQRAAAAVGVEYEPLPAVTSLEAALRASAAGGAGEGVPAVLAACAIEHGDLQRGFAAAEVVVEGSYETGHQEHIYIEPHGIIAIPHAGGGVEVVGSMQCPYYVHKALVRLLGDENAGAGPRVRVRQAVTGGGFGGKEDYPNLIAAHAVLLARRTGRPIKIAYDRHEDIIATSKRHPARIRHRTGVRRDGRLVAMDIDVVLDGGAYTTLSPVVLSRAVIHAGGPYACPNVRIRGRVLATNTPPNGAFRGFGAPQSQFAAERQMDRVARALELDPLAVRERNAYREGDRTPTGQELRASVSAITCLEEAARRTEFRRRWRECEAARRAAGAAVGTAGGAGGDSGAGDAAGRDGGQPLRGIGLALYWHGAGFTGNGERLMRSPAALRLRGDGRVEVRVSSTDFGQGTVAVLAQIAADAVGVPFGAVEVVPADTAEVPDSGPTVASRTVMVVGGVLAQAGRRLARTLCAFAAGERGEEADGWRIAGGQLYRRGTGAAGGSATGGSATEPAATTAEPPAGSPVESSSEPPVESFAGAARRYVAAHGALDIVERYEPPRGEPFDESTYRGAAYPVYGWGCDVVEVSVDPDTLTVRPQRVTMVCDVGRAIHPVLCKGQIEGGTLQALAWGYLEEMKLDAGRYLNDRLATYIIPTALDVPEMETVLVENPAPCGPFGAKGVGELPMDGGAPAVVQAIENATGAVPAAIPATPEQLLDDLMAGRCVPGPSPFDAALAAAPERDGGSQHR